MPIRSLDRACSATQLLIVVQLEPETELVKLGLWFSSD